MISDNADDAPIDTTANRPQETIKDPWTSEDPWSNGRSQQWRTDAHARWQRAQGQTGDAERHADGAHEVNETQEPDELTRAMQDAMAVPLPESPRAYIDADGQVQNPPWYAWNFEDNRPFTVPETSSYSRSYWNDNTQSYWNREDEWWHNDSW